MAQSHGLYHLLGVEDGSKGQYLICLESSDISNISADLQVKHKSWFFQALDTCYSANMRNVLACHGPCFAACSALWQHTLVLCFPSTLVLRCRFADSLPPS